MSYTNSCQKRGIFFQRHKLFYTTGDDGGAGEEIVVRQYNTSNAIAREAKLLDKNGNTSFPGKVSAGSVSATGEIISTTANAFRMVCGNYGCLLRNDGEYMWLLVTPSGNPYGSWNSARPLAVKLATGKCDINGNAATATRATQDSDGNVIKDTYVKKADLPRILTFSAGNTYMSGTLSSGDIKTFELLHSENVLIPSGKQVRCTFQLQIDKSTSGTLSNKKISMHVMLLSADSDNRVGNTSFVITTTADSLSWRTTVSTIGTTKRDFLFNKAYVDIYNLTGTGIVANFYPETFVLEVLN